jgi:hypothetical protein
MGGTMGKSGAAAAVVFAAFSMGGCFGHMDFGDEDSGPQTKQELKLTGFDKVTANGAIDVTITVGEAESINVQGSEERVKNFSAEVKGTTLVLEEKSSGLFGHKGRLHVTITVPKLTAYVVNGSGDATINGVKSDAFSLEVNGSGDITVSGESADCSISVNGSGDINAKGLKTKKASVNIAGSGDIDVSASNDLSVTVAGSGDVTYFGDPKVTTSVTGSGDVEKG